MFCDLRLQVAHVYVAVVVATNNYYTEARHYGARRVRPVRAARDQADGSRCFTARAVPATNREESRVLTLRARVRLQAHRCKAGDLREPRLKVACQLRIASEPRRIGEGVHIGKPWMPDRLHLGSGVQFHRATAEWDHGARQAHILLRESEDVAKHLALRAVQRKDWVRQNFVAAAQRSGERINGSASRRP